MDHVSSLAVEVGQRVQLGNVTIDQPGNPVDQSAENLLWAQRFGHPGAGERGKETIAPRSSR
jgi:hypothetical protein